MLTFTEHTMRGVCPDLNAELVEFNGEADHVHLLVAYPPTVAISVLAQCLKGPHRLHRPARIHRCMSSRPHAWAPLVAVLLRRL